MRSLALLTAALGLMRVAGYGFALSAGTCQDLMQCAQVTFEAVAAGPCGACGIRACLAPAFRGACSRDPLDGISRACAAPRDVCASDRNGTAPTGLTVRAEPFSPFTAGLPICQTGRPGEYVYFGLQDSSKACAPGVQTLPITAQWVGGDPVVALTRCMGFVPEFGTCGSASPRPCTYAVQLPAQSCGGVDADPRCAGGSPEEAAQCESEQQDRYPGYQSTDVFHCNLEQTQAFLLSRGVACHADADCNRLTCADHVPDDLLAELNSLACSPVA